MDFSKFAPPTDNLYKFISIFGILLMLALPAYCIFFSYTQQQEAQADVLEKEILEDEKNDIKNEIIDKIENVDKELEQLKQNYNQEKADDLSESILILENKKKELSKKLIAINSLIDKNTHRKEFINKLRVATTIYLFVGFVITLIGFSLWYFKLQRYQDKIIKKQAEESNNNIQKEIILVDKRTDNTNKDKSNNN
ncbi:hypothetical protein KAR28_06390 [Candidatus Parcubacteria bacterium]|nr:hypothetical protein [Candidatus Parcubacteria bacterium]